jgi:polyisoprenoid-binding protein YceI
MMTAATSYAQLTGDYDIDVAHSRLGFVARHAMVTKIRGALTRFRGQLHLNGAEPSKSWAEVVIDAASIDTGSAERDRHLRSNDFFDMATYPELTFRSTAVEPLGGDRFAVSGELTVRGVTRSIQLDVTYTGSAVDPFGNTRVGLEAHGTIHRKDFGMTWNAPLGAGGVLVSDKIELDIDISAIKRTNA